MKSARQIFIPITRAEAESFYSSIEFNDIAKFLNIKLPNEIPFKNIENNVAIFHWSYDDTNCHGELVLNTDSTYTFNIEVSKYNAIEDSISNVYMTYTMLSKGYYGWKQGNESNIIY